MSAQQCFPFARPADSEDISDAQIREMVGSNVTLGFTSAVIGTITRVDFGGTNWMATVRTRASQTGFLDSDWSRVHPWMEVFDILNGAGGTFVRLTMEYADSKRLINAKKKKISV